jgi:hypothetical protein
MFDRWSRRTFQAKAGMLLGTSTVLGLTEPVQAKDDSKPVIAIVLGPSKHPPGTHEVPATGRLLQYCVSQMIAAQAPNAFELRLLEGWPNDAALLDRIACLVFLGDIFPPMQLTDPPRILADIHRMAERGCGLVCVHYATGLGAQDVQADGSHPLLGWIGGYFATRCPHHQSIARVFEAATIEPALNPHPILQGWESFTIHDEPYIRNYFGADGLMPGVVILATSQLPPENPKAEPVAWAIERPDGGRGAGIVMPHFFKNWQQEGLRKLILNAIWWASQQKIPPNGIDIRLDELAQFQPQAVEPVTRKGKS